MREDGTARTLTINVENGEAMRALADMERAADSAAAALGRFAVAMEHLRRVLLTPSST